MQGQEVTGFPAKQEMQSQASLPNRKCLWLNCLTRPVPQTCVCRLEGLGLEGSHCHQNDEWDCYATHTHTHRHVHTHTHTHLNVYVFTSATYAYFPTCAQTTSLHEKYPHTHSLSETHKHTHTQTHWFDRAWYRSCSFTLTTTSAVFSGKKGEGCCSDSQPDGSNM